MIYGMKKTITKILNIVLRAVLILLVLVLVTWLYRATYNVQYSQQVLDQDMSQETYNIVAFGDSLVEGLGSPELGGFVPLLEARLDVEIYNAGVRRHRTGDLLQRVHEDVLVWDPSVVILVVGGNDILRGIQKEVMLENLDQLFTLFSERNITVVYGEPGFSEYIFEDYAQDVALVAERFDNVIYVPDLLSGFFFDPRKKSDLLHPNDDGYEIMADRLEMPLCRAIGLCVLGYE